MLIWCLYPFVKLSEKLTSGMTEGPMLSGFSRQEFAAMAELSAKEGQLAERESEVLKNLLLLRDTGVKDAMTPRPVVFSLPRGTTVEAFFGQHEDNRFSRIPVYEDDPDALGGFVLRADLLLAQARGQCETPLAEFERPMPVLPESLSLAQAFRDVLRHRSHIAQIVDEYGVLEGILTLEDIIETLLGLEIVDEGDKAVDMQEHARKLWRRRAEKMGIEPPEV